MSSSTVENVFVWISCTKSAIYLFLKCYSSLSWLSITALTSCLSLVMRVSLPFIYLIILLTLSSWSATLFLIFSMICMIYWFPSMSNVRTFCYIYLLYPSYWLALSASPLRISLSSLTYNSNDYSLLISCWLCIFKLFISYKNLERSWRFAVYMLWIFSIYSCADSSSTLFLISKTLFLVLNYL